MPIFWWVTLIFLPLDHFFNLFKGISKIKGHFFADECPFFLSKCPFFFGIPLKRLKKWSRDKKMSVTHQKMGIWPRKHLWRSLWPLKTSLGVKSPFFYLKGPLLFLGVMINRLKNLLREKKVRVTQQIMGIGPIEHLQNTEKHNFLHYRNKKDLQMGVLRLQTSFYDRIWPKESLLCDISEQNGVLEVL